MAQDGDTLLGQLGVQDPPSEGDKLLERTITRSTPVGFVEAATTTAFGTRKEAWDWVPFVATGREGVGWVDMYQAGEAFNLGAASDDQRDMLEKFLDYHSREMGFWGGVGDIAGDLPTFAVEFGAGLSIATWLGKKALKTAGGKALHKALKRMAETKIAGALEQNVATRTAGKLVGAGLAGVGVGVVSELPRAPWGRVMANARRLQFQRRFGLDRDEAGQLVLEVLGDPQSLLDVLPVAIVDELIEYSSEMTGGAIPFVSKLDALHDDLLGFLFGKIGVKKGREFFAKYGIHGAWSEVGEEYLGAAAREAVGAVAGVEEFRGALPETFAQTLEMYTAFALRGGVGSARGAFGEGVRKSLEKRQREAIIKRLRDEAEVAGVTRDDEVLERMADAEMEKAAAAQPLTDEQRPLTEAELEELEKLEPSEAEEFLTAYHGTGAEIGEEGFLDEKIGTGEGAQAFGYGHYFTDTRSVAEFYERQVSPGSGNRPKDIAARTVASFEEQGNSREEAEVLAIEEIRRRAETGNIPEWMEDTGLPAIAAIKDGSYRGAVYQVRLAPKSEELLLWDKPLSEQSEQVRGALAVLGYEDSHESGEDVYRRLSGATSKRGASAALLKAGIRGIKYLDATSREEGEGSFNYVIFDPADIAIQRPAEAQVEERKEPGPTEEPPPEASRGRAEAPIAPLPPSEEAEGKPPVPPAAPVAEAEEEPGEPAPPETGEGKEGEDEPAAAIHLSEAREGAQFQKLSKWQDLRTKIQDAALPIELWEKEGDKQGGDFTTISVRDAISAYSGKVQARADEIQRLNRAIEGEARKQDFWGLGQEGATEMIGDVISARDAVDRNPFLLKSKDVEAGSGMTDAEAQAILDEHLSKPGVQKIADMVVELNHGARVQMLDSGIISQETFDFWEETFPNYAPQRTTEVDPEGRGYVGPGRAGYQVSRTVVYAMEGRKTRADNPLMFSFAQAEAFNQASEKARVGGVMWEVINNPANAKFTSYEELEQPEDRSSWEPKNAFGVWVKGEYKVMRVSSAPVNRAMKSLGYVPVPKLLRAHGQVVRLMGRLITSWNPNFMIPNFFRDLGTAGVNIAVERQQGIRRKVLKSLFPAMRAIGAVEFRGKPAETELGKFYSEVFVPGGGLIGWSRDRPFDQVKRDMVRSWKRGPVRRTLGGLVGFIESGNAVIEMGVRVSTAYELAQAGVPTPKAIRAARELTVDFNRRGEWTANLSAYKMFLNARIQGASQMLINVHRRPAIAAMGAGITAAAFGHSIMMFFAMGDDDDGEARWFKKADWERDRNLMLVNPLADNPNETFKVPLAYGYNVFWVLGDRLAEAIMRVTEHGEDPTDVASKVAERVAAAMWDGFSPVSEASLMQMLSPTGLTPVVQITENTAWHGGPIFPEGNPFDPAPPPDSERAFSSVAPLSQETARFLNRMFGGNKFRAGSFLGADMSVSPESLEHMYESYLGGLAKMAANAYKLATKPWADTGWNKVPVLRRFYSDDTMFADRELYYAAIEDVHRASKEVKGMASPPALAQRLAPLLSHAKAATKHIQALRERRERATDPDVLRELDEQLRQIYLRFNRTFNQRRWR